MRALRRFLGNISGSRFRRYREIKRERFIRDWDRFFARAVLKGWRPMDAASYRLTGYLLDLYPPEL